MLNICYECDNNLQKEIGTVYGYWGDIEIKFIDLPKYKCPKCKEFYLDEEIAVLTQEITRALSDIKNTSKVVDISDSYEILIDYMEEVYEMIVYKKIHLIETETKIIINMKDVKSLFYDKGALIAARNNKGITEDVEKEINKLTSEDEEK